MRATSPKNLERRPGFRRNVVAIASTLVVGLLLWARLIVITDMPRTAIADDGADAQANVGADSRAPSSDKGHETPAHAQLERVPNRDPFLLPEDQFPKEATNSDIPAEPEKSTVQVTEDPP